MSHISELVPAKRPLNSKLHLAKWNRKRERQSVRRKRVKRSKRDQQSLLVLFINLPTLYILYELMCDMR